jgi:pimeloyl-ACP methyl ester carboxylesterase
VPKLSRPGGIQIHWEERGEGPLVVLATQFFGSPAIFEALIADLATDHRVVSYDLRGTGESTRDGPYDIATDAADLAALIESIGGPAVVVGWGDGCNRAVWVSAERPDVISAIVTPGGNPVGREASQGTDALVDSPSVIQAMLAMIETDYRGALRTIIGGANPQLSEEEARLRVDGIVEYCAQDVGAARLRAWIDDDPREAARALGGRLWILSNANEDNPWFTPAGLDRTRELLPEVQIEEVEGGAISRPDVTAGIVRRITAPGGSGGEGGESSEVRVGIPGSDGRA